jgi:hypothetical protein
MYSFTYLLLTIFIDMYLTMYLIDIMAASRAAEKGA